MVGYNPNYCHDGGVQHVVAYTKLDEIPAIWKFLILNCRLIK